MTHSPTPENEPSPGSRDRRWVRRLRQIGIPLGVVSLAGVAGATWWGWNFVHNDLAPLVEKSLTKSLDRPVKLGRVERFTPFSLRFGPSSLPPTATDPDQLSIQAVDVAFNPFRLIFSRDLNLDITAVKPEIYLEQAKDGAWVTTKIDQEEQTGPVKTELRTIRFQDARAVLVPWAKTGRKGIPIVLSQLNGKADLLDRNQRFNYEVTGKSETGGNLQLNGETLRRAPDAPAASAPALQTNLQVRGQNFLVSEIDRLVNIPSLTLDAGRADGNLTVQLRSDQKLPSFTGTAQFKGVTLKAQGVPRPFTRATGALRLQGRRIQIDNTNAFYGKVPILVSGVTDLEKGFDITAKVKLATLPSVVETLQVPLPFAVAGTIAADLKLTGPLLMPILSGTARSLKPGRLDKVDLSQYSAQFQLDTFKRAIAISSIKATPTAGGAVTGSGQIKLANPAQIALNFQAVGVPGNAIASSYNGNNPPPVNVGRLDARTQIAGPANNLQILTRWQASGGDYPGTGEILIANGVTTLRDTVLGVAGGTARVEARAAAGRWQAIVAGSQIRLRQFSKDLRGLFSGNLALSGSLTSLKPADVRGQGQVRFSEGISVIGKPLTAQIQWDGQKVVVQRATAPGFSASGAVFAQLEGAGAPAISALDLNVRASDYDLQAFALPLPVKVDYSGRADFAGRLTGTPANPNIAGGLALKDFVLNGQQFDRLMQGSLRVARGVRLDLAGERDRISATLGSNYQLLAFNVQFDTEQNGEKVIATANGSTRGGLLYVETENFPLGILASSGTAALFPVGGELTTNGPLALDLKKLSVTGAVDIANPSFGTFRADQFSGRINFANGVATLSKAQLIQRGYRTEEATTIQIDATANIQGDPSVKGTIRLVQGRLQDILKLLQLSDIQDLAQKFQPSTYGSSADLETVPVELQEASLLTQLRRLAEVQALQQMAKEQRANAPIPELRDLTGSVSGEINVNGSLKKGINATFNLSGENWVWGPYSAKQVVAIGSFENGAVTLLPLRFQSDQSFISFSGQVGGKQQSGQFRMENVPADALQRLLPMSVPIEGNLNATATLAGSQTNPQAIGEISLTNGTLNGKEVKEARGGFQYANARLDFGSRIVISAPEPISIVGSLPFQLPIQGAVKPTSDQISLDINVKDDGLAALNVLNNQVEWLDGKGSVALKVRGTLRQPDADGTIQLNGATLKARALPDPITDVRGVIAFKRDRLTIAQPLTGQLSQGQVSVVGTLPLAVPFDPAGPDGGNSLAVKLENLKLNLKGLYQGAVAGNVDVRGAALNPVLGGFIELSNGQVLLSDQTAAAGSTTGTPTTGEPATDSAETGSNVEFNNLKLSLGKNVRITRAPILNFVASGDLTINGELGALRPEGTITLNSGVVNLFTTQFTLARGYPQTAQFVPQQGLDPNLDIRLIALVSEVIGSRQPTSASPNEIVDAPDFYRYGSVQSVRVQARINGPASELNNNLELTSSPARSQSEIVSLIGGGFISTLGQGGALGLANIAGSALLTNIQGFIGNALGLSDFRLFPTITPNEDSRDSRSGSNLDLAVEAGIDLTRTLSFSVLKILTADQPAQFGLRYRLNDEILLRTSTDFSGDNRAVIEYETRF